MGRSIATIDKPEFINIKPYNPLISQCEIKVLYVGENRNRSFITKEVAADMANSLPGCPIVGYYNEGKEDFMDHGQRITMDSEGVKFETLTKPYGFVAPDAQVWFQKFDDTDEFGNVTQREYMMTTGYLWTGQYEEAMGVIEHGNNQSMELDEKTLQGNWATNNKTGVEFFIINDAIFSKLAILGRDVEPCFEGADITAPKLSTSFSMDEEFTTTLFSMMQDLQTAIETKEGGLNMTKEELIASGKAPTEFTAEEKALFSEDELGAMITEFEAKEAAEFAAADKKKTDEEAAAVEDAGDGGADDAAENADGTPKKEKKPATKSQLELDFEDLQAKYTKLEAEVVGLREFKVTAENSEKDALIESFYMLSDEDKADVVANKSNYSLDEIESKLAVICVRKKVSFDLEDNDDADPDKAKLIFSLDDGGAPEVPAYIQVIRDARDAN